MLEDYIKASNKIEHIIEQFMADTTPVTKNDIPALLNIAEKLQNGDTSLNTYILYKHPEAQAKLFSQIAEACYMELDLEPDQQQREKFIDYLDECYKKIVSKNLQQTDKQKLCNLLEFMELPKDLEEQFIKDIGVSGLLN